MDAILVHGMGRTPASMAILAARLRIAGMRPRFFAYSAALESRERCVCRLEDFVMRHASAKDYILVGHSLGAVLIRAALPQLDWKPAACFFLAPPSRPCRAAIRLAPFGPYRWFTGEMGQLLADPEFMASLPVPDLPTKIYAGIASPRGTWSPFGHELNDGILTLEETKLPSVPVQTVASLHTFIMNAPAVADDIRAFTESLAAIA